MNISKVSGICGIISLILAFIFITAAILQAPAFSWQENCLSDLGGMGAGSLIFNIGLILSGLAALVFSYGLFKIRKFGTRTGMAGTVLLMLASLMLLLIGIFPVGIDPVHFIVSAAFFILSPLSVLILGIHIIREERDLGILSVILGIIGFYSLSIPFLGNCASNEVVSIIPVALFVAIFGFKLFRE